MTASAHDRILLTAHELFYRDGIRATGIDKLIAEAGVTKVTFYRHFPSKNTLILAVLEYRHRLWMDWFDAALTRAKANKHSGIAALVPALSEWLSASEFRGCAFINSTVEFGESIPEVQTWVSRHKQEMAERVRELLPDNGSAELDSEAIALAIDGAIVRAQIDGRPEKALAAFSRLMKAFL